MFRSPCRFFGRVSRVRVTRFECDGAHGEGVWRPMNRRSAIVVALHSLSIAGCVEESAGACPAVVAGVLMVGVELLVAVHWSSAPFTRRSVTELCE